MNETEYVQIIDATIAVLANAKEKAKQAGASDDHAGAAMARRAAGAVSELLFWIDKQPAVEEVAKTLDPGDGHEFDKHEDAVSAVADLHVPEAIDAISRMRSTEKLQGIVDSESRVSVQVAARKRIEELEGKADHKAEDNE